MPRRAVQYCLRLPQTLYRDSVDLALVFDLSLNRFFTAAIEQFVASQLQQESTKRAIERVREARLAGLVNAPPDAEAAAAEDPNLVTGSDAGLADGEPAIDTLSASVRESHEHGRDERRTFVRPVPPGSGSR